MTECLKAQTPLSVTPELRRVLTAVVPEPEPFFLEVQAPSWAIELNCYGNVETAIRRLGGGQLAGWLIRIWPRVLVELQHHAIWIQPDGVPRDVTPAIPPNQKVPKERVQLFLADPESADTYTDTSTRQLTLPGNTLNTSIVQARMEMLRAHTAGDERKVHHLMDELEALYDQRNWKREPSDPCPCGSRRTYADCHGR